LDCALSTAAGDVVHGVDKRSDGTQAANIQTTTPRQTQSATNNITQRVKHANNCPVVCRHTDTVRYTHGQAHTQTGRQTE
jgi:peptide subunit release factor 1 (eRF1)